MAIIYSVLQVTRIHQHAQFQAIHFMRSPANARKPLGKDGQADGRMDIPQNGHGWSDGTTDPCTVGISGFRRMDGRTEGWTDKLKT